MLMYERFELNRHIPHIDKKYWTSDKKCVIFYPRLHKGSCFGKLAAFCSVMNIFNDFI